MLEIRYVVLVVVLISPVPRDGHAQPAFGITPFGAKAVPALDGVPASRVQLECKPWWTRRIPADTLEIAIVTGGVGSTEVSARESAEAKVPFAIAVLVSELVEGTIDPALSQKLRGSVEAFGTGARIVEASDYCKGQVWVLARIPRIVVVQRIESIDTLARGIDRVLLPALREQMQKSKPSSRPSLMFRSAYAPGSVQRASGRDAYGRSILGAVLAGGVAGVGGSVAAQHAANKAMAETSSNLRRDDFNRQSDRYSSVSRTGWLLAGAGYALGILDAASVNPNHVSMSLVSGRIVFTIPAGMRGRAR